MSSLIVEVVEVDEIKDHPQADRMKVACIKGWEVCIGYDPTTGKAQFEKGQKCVYIPYDAVLPLSLANAPTDTPPGRLNVAKYCAPVKDDAGIIVGYRVRAVKLRGYKSFGIIMALDPKFGDDPDWTVGTDLIAYYGIGKWEPPVTCEDGDAARPHNAFHKYTDIEKFANFPDALIEGEEVVMTEKIHGSNFRNGKILDTDEAGNPQWVWAAGSHNVQRKEFNIHGEKSKFWEIFSDNVKALIDFIISDAFQWHRPKIGVVVFGEVFGNQDMRYGLENGKHDVRYFDIAVNGEYLDHDVKAELFKQFGLQQVPIIYRGPFSKEILNKHTDGTTTLCDPSKAGKFAGREGVVVTPVKERGVNAFGSRCIFKSVSVDYIARKDSTDIVE